MVEFQDALDKIVVMLHLMYKTVYLFCCFLFLTLFRDMLYLAVNPYKICCVLFW